MKDWMGREISYLRISLTERCDLKCIYCRSENSYCKGSGELSLAELTKLVNAFAELGITKIRLTGGEPLVRKDILEIVRMIALHPEIRDIAMTTNAQGLPGKVSALKEAGLKRLNISLDSLRPDRYRDITRGGSLSRVLDGVEQALDLGLGVKINVVLVRGRNEDEIGDFIAFAKRYPVDVRFIELMPFGVLGEDGSRRITGAEILDAHPELGPVPPRDISQPSADYSGDGFRGRVGLISPVSHRFCSRCNRVRLTSDGKIRMCLGQNQEMDIRPYISENADRLRKRIADIIYNKPERHAFEKSYHANRRMNQIGG